MVYPVAYTGSPVSTSKRSLLNLGVGLLLVGCANIPPGESNAGDTTFVERLGLREGPSPTAESR